jgi:hypothetical protein
MGGAVKGKRIFGQYPSLAVNPNSGPEVNPLDTGRGRFIPTTSCDEFFAELALWLGVSKSNLPLVLPNIANFYSLSSSAPPVGFLLCAGADERQASRGRISICGKLAFSPAGLKASLQETKLRSFSTARAGELRPSGSPSSLPARVLAVAG